MKIAEYRVYIYKQAPSFFFGTVGSNTQHSPPCLSAFLSDTSPCCLSTNTLSLKLVLSLSKTHMACERRRDMETNLNLKGSDEITNKPENGNGRRRSKLNIEPAQKKKQPQRGMGVEKLEMLMVQENNNRLKNPLHSLTLQNYQLGTTPSSFADPSIQMHLAKLGSYGATHPGLNQPLLLQRLGTGGFQLDPYGFRSGSNSTAHNVGSTLIETTARDQLCKVPSVKCYSEQCGVCHKVKKKKNASAHISKLTLIFVPQKIIFCFFAKIFC